MSRAILVLNVGSSSIKFGLYALSTLELLCRGQIVEIGSAAGFSVEGSLSDRLAAVAAPPQAGDHAALTQWLLTIIEKNLGEIEICTAGHRVVHGGLNFHMPTLITPEVIAVLERYCALAPNHQPHNLAAIRNVAATWPNIVQFACFDTSFHHTQPRVAQLFGLPRALTDEGILRYGFHGLSYEYIAGVLPLFIGQRALGKVVVAHLGHGASMCAMVNCRSMGTSMGFTALDGLMMGKRCGALDPGVVLHLIEYKGMSAADVAHLLTNESGLLGVSGLSDDIRQLLASERESAAEAIELFVYRAVRELGALIATIGGLDALVFTAGIGEHSAVIRQRIVDNFTWLGADIDRAANDADDIIISSPQSKIDVVTIPTNEEVVIARAAVGFVRAAN